MSVLGVLICLVLLAACWVPREPNKALFWGALIGGAVSLIGGAKNRKAQREANAANSPAGQVAQWEAAGINPLFGISSGGYVPQQAASMGDSFAAAGAQFGQAFDQDKEQELRETNLELQNDKLRKQLDQLAKPSEPSHLQTYGGLVPFPRFGVGNAGSKSGGNSVRLDGLRADGPQASAGRDLRVVTPYGTVETVPNWTPTEDIETEYGEPAAWLYSGVRAADAVADIVGVPVVNAYLDHVGKPFADWMTSIGDDQGRYDARSYGDKWGNSPPRSIRPTQREIDRAGFRRNALGGL